MTSYLIRTTTAFEHAGEQSASRGLAAIHLILLLCYYHYSDTSNTEAKAVSP